MNYRMRDVGLAVAAVAAFASGASAQDGRFYVGISANGGALGVAYEKTVIVREGAPVANPPAVGDTHVRPSSSFDRGVTIGSGLFAGYRRRFADDGRFFSAEAQVAGAGGSARGYLPGTGMQRGENWPERWSFGKNWAAGLTGRVGTPVNGIDLYLLGGARVTQVAFGAETTGCEHPVCSADGAYPDFVRGTVARHSTLAAWSVGVGVEKPMRPDLAFRWELSYIGYATDEGRTEFDPDPAGMPTISVPSRFSSNDVELTFSLVRYF
ncbi:MAG: hypothetical protein OXH04_06985 [Acidobacteria bacterium]|nr:hypothetical protein [Acidobacteriota bacterium]